MTPFIECTGPAAVLARDNVDTDMIVRIERLTTLKRGEFGPWAFETLRFRPDGSEQADFVLNQPPFRQARILIAGENFGCGSSREMAVWALEDFGIRCVIAVSFGDIFYSNCLQNGVLPITLPAAQIAALAGPAAHGLPLRVDLRSGVLAFESGLQLPFDFPSPQREALLEGQDTIDQSLALQASIQGFQAQDRQARPWVYGSGH